MMISREFILQVTVVVKAVVATKVFLTRIRPKTGIVIGTAHTSNLICDTARVLEPAPRI